MNTNDLLKHDSANAAMGREKAEREQGSTGSFLSRLMAKVTGPMPIIAGPDSHHVRVSLVGRPSRTAPSWIGSSTA
jgi:hypothetical protein